VRPAPLPARFFARDAASVARDLLGRLLVSEIGGRRAVVRIVETEAYTGPRDGASHAAGWHRSPRNEAMYGPPGRAYVYFTYGIHWCFNVVTGRPGFPSAVLVRAGEPVEGLVVMRRRRGPVPDRLLAAGPARLAQALGITRALDGHLLASPPLWIAAGEPVPPTRRRRGTRVGVRRAADRLLRFCERDSPCLSRP
jgi:DNA-3-methyladenine glycosylase